MHGRLIVLGYHTYRVVSPPEADRGTASSSNNASDKKDGTSRRRVPRWEPLGSANTIFDLVVDENDQDNTASQVVLKPPRTIELSMHAERKCLIECDSKELSRYDVFQLGRMPGGTNAFIVPGPVFNNSGP